MPQLFKQLFGAAPVATTLVVIYTAPAATQVLCSTIMVANRSASATTVRLTHAPAGAADAVQHTFLPDVSLAGNTAITLTLGICMQPTDVLRAYVGAATVTILGWGEERT